MTCETLLPNAEREKKLKLPLSPLSDLPWPLTTIPLITSGAYHLARIDYRRICPTGTVKPYTLVGRVCFHLDAGCENKTVMHMGWSLYTSDSSIEYL